MRRILQSSALAASLAIAGAGAAPAQGMAVYDATAVLRAIDQIENQIAQLETMRAQLESLTGAKGMSGILNSAGDRAGRFSAESLSGIMDNAMTGAGIGGNAGALTARIDDLKTTFDLEDVSGFLGSDLSQDRAIATQAGSGMAAMATAEDTYARTDAATDRVNQLIDGIDGTADLKASVDYNTRVLGEIAVILNESLRVQAAMANAMGSTTLGDARAGVAQRTFMQAGDEG